MRCSPRFVNSVLRALRVPSHNMKLWVSFLYHVDPSISSFSPVGMGRCNDNSVVGLILSFLYSLQ